MQLYNNNISIANFFNEKIDFPLQLTFTKASGNNLVRCKRQNGDVVMKG